jgi:minor extracellular protease Epr
MRKILPLLLGLTVSAMATAQVLAPVGRTVGGVVDTVTGQVIDPLTERTGALLNNVSQLAADRVTRLTGLVQRNRDTLELDDRGDPAVRGEVLGVDISPAGVAAARKAGFILLDDSEIGDLGIHTVRLAAPKGMSLARALRTIRKAAPGEWTANQLHFESGVATLPATGLLAASQIAGAAKIGMIDGGIGQHPSLSGPIEQKGFVSGAPQSSAHGTAIAALIAGEGSFKGVLPGAPLLAADVYGKSPAGGNALAIAQAIGWMTGRRVTVISISLVGPPNPLLAKTVSAAHTRGTFIVAAVGNDGPAAPTAYPASYPGVIAVTGVDARNRALIEAGRALHIDYAAPGADMAGAKAGGGTVPLRGTSYAAPLVAARLAGQAKPDIALLDREAVDLGKRGPDKIYGRGLICGNCRN